MQHFQAFVSSLSIGSPTSVDGLSVYPLLRTPAPAPFYDTLSDAVRAGTLHISEMSDGGSVPELRVVNDGKRPVLIIDGEELVGAKQNRIVNLTVLVPELATITLPVTCVEAGRWHHVSPEFAPAERAYHASGRRSKLDQVSMSMLTNSSPRADQSAVWSEIAQKSERMGTRSPTGAAAAMYEQRRDGLDKMIASIKPMDHQVGAVFAIRGMIAGFDAFDSPPHVGAGDAQADAQLRARRHGHRDRRRRLRDARSAAVRGSRVARDVQGVSGRRRRAGSPLRGRRHRRRRAGDGDGRRARGGVPGV